MKSLIKSIVCFFRPNCPVFRGDEFTEWTREQERMALQSADHIRRIRESESLFDDIIFPKRETPAAKKRRVQWGD